MKAKPSLPAQSPSTVEATPFDDGDLYDLIFEHLDLGLDFYLGLARAARGPVLDVGCGTGRILLPCLKAGVDAEGLDLFPGMLARRGDPETSARAVAARVRGDADPPRRTTPTRQLRLCLLDHPGEAAIQPRTATRAASRTAISRNE